MPDVNRLEPILVGYGYRLGDPVVVGGTFSCQLGGEELGETEPYLRATELFCNVGMVVGVLDAALPRGRYSLVLDLLELNFEHPLARISMFRAPSQKNDDPHVGVLVAETSFYWSEITEEKFDGRMKALRAIAHDASELLAAKHALSKVNPFFAKLKSPQPPVERADLPMDPSTDE